MRATGSAPRWRTAADGRGYKQTHEGCRGVAMKPPRRPCPPTLAIVVGEALVLVAELHPDHWPSWLGHAHAAALGDPWSAGSTNTLRLALARDVAQKRGRGPTCAAELAELRSALREVSR